MMMLLMSLIIFISDLVELNELSGKNKLTYFYFNLRLDYKNEILLI